MLQIKEMSHEDLKAMMIGHEVNAIEAGFKDSEEFENFKYNASMGMIKFGGSFTTYLGEALARADMYNSKRLINAFREMCEHHAKLFIQSNIARMEIEKDV